ncbi:alkaline phosphatase family protein [bacterium]|nr:alkaline phosphatase family protein [bacterium]
MKKVIFLLLDGARKDTVEKYLDLGYLPNLNEIINNGGSISSATSVFPSTTGPAYTPFLMGLFPGNANLPGIRWFDKVNFSKNKLSLMAHRSYVGIEGLLLNDDIKKSNKTIFEIVKNSRSIFNEITRGLQKEFDLTRISKGYYKIKSHFSGSSSIDLTSSKKLLSSLDKKVEFIFCCYLGVDSNSHIHGHDSKEVLDSYKSFDFELGKVIQKLKDNNELDDSLLIVTSDHGHSNTNSHIELVDVLKKQGFKVFSYPLVFSKLIKDIDAAVMVSGNSMAHLYFRKEKDWSKRKTFNGSEKIIEDLVRNPGIDILIFINEKSQIIIRSIRGMAMLEDKESGLEYTPLVNDPFDYKNLKGLLTYEEILDKTFDTDYPDALTQIHQLFNSNRCGDLVISSNEGFDLRDNFEIPEHKSSHGSLKKEHMLVPLIMNKKVTEDKIRTVDLFPTILRFLNYKSPIKTDGKKLDIN